MSNRKSTSLDDDEEEVSEGRGLTEKQAAFVAAYVDGPTAGNAKKSALAAGYSEISAGPQGCMLLKLPHVAQAIEAALREAIGTTLVVQAVDCIRTIINDPNAPQKLRGQLAAKVVEFSGLADRVQDEKAKQTGLGGRKMTEIPIEDLERFAAAGIAMLEQRAAGAKLIEGTKTGDSAQDSAQATDVAAE